MGQFASRAFDGDPYIDLMRAMPERELVWWTQKVIWLAEGFTFVDHAIRTYPTMFTHTCNHCKGAGSITCPCCSGHKLLPPAPEEEKLAEKLGRSAVPQPCGVCGPTCSWDAESEWEERWKGWEATLAYYDRSLGPIYDEWYEDVVNAGNLDDDTPVPEEDPPGPDELPGVHGDILREMAPTRERRRLDALLKRAGHPYDNDEMIAFKVVDPTRSPGENMWNMIQAYNNLPPELNPLVSPHLLVDPNSPLAAFDDEINMEGAIMQNLQAAARDQPKPNRFPSTAGTVSCPECNGQAWSYSFIPNVRKLLRVEQPFWAATLQGLNGMWAPGRAAATAAATAGPSMYAERGGPLDVMRVTSAPELLDTLTGRNGRSVERYRDELRAIMDDPSLRSAARTIVTINPKAVAEERALAEVLQEEAQSSRPLLEDQASPLSVGAEPTATASATTTSSTSPSGSGSGSSSRLGSSGSRQLFGRPWSALSAEEREVLEYLQARSSSSSSGSTKGASGAALPAVASLTAAGQQQQR